jgi:hypothetical protein
MITPSFNKYRAALEVLQRGRDQIVDELVEEVLDNGDDLLDSGYQFHEMLEVQGTRLHFLGLLVSQLEQSADALDEVRTPPSPPPSQRRRPRSKKATSQTTPEGRTEDLS